MYENDYIISVNKYFSEPWQAVLNRFNGFLAIFNFGEQISYLGLFSQIFYLYYCNWSVIFYVSAFLFLFLFIFININGSSSLHRLKVNYINLEEREKKTNLIITESDICILFSSRLNKCIFFLSPILSIF